MFSLNPMKELYESPLPPMALTDYEAFSKFLNQALHCCHETGRDFNVYLDWAIRALASSMAADSAARPVPMMYADLRSTPSGLRGRTNAS